MTGQTLFDLTSSSAEHPCQAFSVAGLRQGLEDPRGNLTLVFLGILAQFRPRWVVWENVPGVLSDKTGAFGAFLGGLGELGYGFAYRILDAQFFGVAQRRRRVFVVGYIGDWRRAAAVLFEPESLRGDSPPSRKARKGIAGGFETGPSGGGFTDIYPTLDTRCKDGPIRNQLGGGVIESFAIQAGALRENPNSGPDGVGVQTEHAYTLEARAEVQAICMATGQAGAEIGIGIGTTLNCNHEAPIVTHEVAHTLRASGFDASEDGMGRGTPLVPVAFRTSGNCGAWATGDKTDALTTGTDPNSHVLAFEPRCARNGRGMPSDVVPALKAEAGSTGKGDAAPCVANHTAVRRLTPTECERLQGFPDGHTLIPYRNKPACDGPRYKALGNSMAVPVMRWIGERIQEVDQLKP
jgi:DNA (cytosine-5)-methyltransferase 1